MTSGQNLVYHLGHDLTTNNTGYLGFHYIASGSYENYLTMGFFGNDNLNNFTSSGHVVLGTTLIGNAGLVVNQPWSSGDLFSASQSGTTKFTISNTGAITDSTYAGNNAVLYATASTGLFTGITTSSSNLCLVSGASAPAWGSCSSSNYWNLASGTLSPINSTLDLLIGGTATTSAKFAVLNVNSGTPTASVSAGAAGAAYLTAAGKLATTAKQTLSLGDANTGNVLFNQGGNVGIGSSNPTTL